MEYPEWSVFNPNDNGQMGKLLSWLEDTKIRFWKTEDRRAIRVTSSSSPAAAKAVFPSEAQRLYLKSVGCPARAMRTNAMVANWLVNHAISLEYRDMSKKKKSCLFCFFGPPQSHAALHFLPQLITRIKTSEALFKRKVKKKKKTLSKSRSVKKKKKKAKMG